MFGSRVAGGFAPEPEGDPIPEDAIQQVFAAGSAPACA
jgi:hypothetical protein